MAGKRGRRASARLDAQIVHERKSDEIRDVIDVAMPEAGVQPRGDVVTYNTLINMLRIEGDDEAAKKVFEDH